MKNSVMAALLLVGCAAAPKPAPTSDAKPITAFNRAMAGSAPDVAQRVDSARIPRARGEPQNWLTYYGAYDGQRYSALDQINPSNVKDLKVAWVFQHGPMTLM